MKNNFPPGYELAINRIDLIERLITLLKIFGIKNLSWKKSVDGNNVLILRGVEVIGYFTAFSIKNLNLRRTAQELAKALKRMNKKP